MANWLLFDTKEEAEKAEKQILNNLNANWHNKAKGYSIIARLDNGKFGFVKPGLDYPANNTKDVVCKEELQYSKDWFKWEVTN